MSDPGRPRVVLLAGRGASSNTVYHALCDMADVVAVIEEDPPSNVKLVKRRVKRLGLLPVIDQVVFITVVSRILRFTSEHRADAIRKEHGLRVTPIPTNVVEAVSSINDPSVMECLRTHRPDVVVVNGTRIIKRHVLECIEAQFINTHTGITPAYRGVHGGYWALAEGKPDLAGVTVHYVDAGIDTGKVISQALIHPTPEDNFHTYPVLQLAAALELLQKAVLDTCHHGSQLMEPLSNTSRLYYHPGFSQYLISRFRDGVR